MICITYRTCHVCEMYYSIITMSYDILLYSMVNIT